MGNFKLWEHELWAYYCNLFPIMVNAIYLSIYLYIYIPGCYPPKREVVKTRYTRIHGNITLPSTSVSCLFIREYTEEGLSRSLALSLLLPFTNHRDYGGRILIASTTRQCIGGN